MPVLVLVLALFCAPLAAATLPEPCRVKIADFFTAVGQGENEAAISQLLDRVISWRGTGEAKKMIAVLNTLDHEAVGSLIDWEAVGQRQLSPNYFVVFVMVRYQRQPIFYRIAFYRADRDWFVSQLNMNTDVVEVIDEWLPDLPLESVTTAADIDNPIP